MTQSDPIRYIAFAGTKRIASGDLGQVALKAKEVMDRDKWVQVLIFDDVTSDLIEVDLRGTAADASGSLVSFEVILPIIAERDQAW